MLGHTRCLCSVLLRPWGPQAGRVGQPSTGGTTIDLSTPCKVPSRMWHLCGYCEPLIVSRILTTVVSGVALKLHVKEHFIVWGHCQPRPTSPQLLGATGSVRTARGPEPHKAVSSLSLARSKAE